MRRPPTTRPRVDEHGPSDVRLGRRRVTGSVAFLGPAFVAGIAYVDPGNFATNFAAGAQYGYTLLWVVVAANLVAVLVQSLSAKLGLATGRSLAEVGRDRYRRPVVIALWLQAEAVAIATDLAEIVGGAIALQLLFGLPLPAGAVITAVAAYALLALRNRGHRPFELAVAGLFVVIAAGLLYDAVAARPSASGVIGGLVPGSLTGDAVVLATAMVGATVMPHAVYVHSALTRRQTPVGSELDPARALRLQRLDIGIAMGVAGVVNAAMVIIAAATLSGTVGGIAAYHQGLLTTVGAAAGLMFLVSLLASGLASSGVGTYAGEVVMAGFLRRRVPRLLRRAITIVPCLALLAMGVGATDALVVSQFVLGLGVPIALVTLILATRDRTLMGRFVNRRRTTALASCCAAAVIAVDLYSLGSLFG